MLMVAAMRDLYMKNGQGFILVYSIVALSTFNELTEIHAQIVRVKDDPTIPTVVVGNKLDLEADRCVSTSQGKNLAKQLNGCPFWEASAKTCTNVDKVFFNLISEIDKRTSPAEPKKKCLLF